MSNKQKALQTSQSDYGLEWCMGGCCSDFEAL